MDEEETKVDENATTPTGEGGDKPTADEEIRKLNADTERINKAIAENEKAKAQARLGGLSEAGSKSLTKEESETKEAQKLADEISGAFI